MATRKIIRMGNPILATIAQPIQPDDAASLPDVIQDMIDTMRAANGVGLAAPQIGLSMRLIVFEIPRGIDKQPVIQTFPRHHKCSSIQKSRILMTRWNSVGKAVYQFQV